MLITESLKVYYRHEAKANSEFHYLAQKIDELLQNDGIYLNFPVDIADKCHQATWEYISMLTEANPDDDDDEEESSPFIDLTIGLYVTTEYVVGKNLKKPYLTVFIGNDDGDPMINLNLYELCDELNMLKITNDIANAVATIRELEVFISNMDPQRGEIALNLLSNVFDC